MGNRCTVDWRIVRIRVQFVSSSVVEGNTKRRAHGGKYLEREEKTVRLNNSPFPLPLVPLFDTTRASRTATQALQLLLGTGNTISYFRTL